MMLVLKGHHYASDYPFADDLNSIKMLRDRDIEAAGFRLYEFVACFDALLTDYSSIFFDYLLLNRPIGFTVDDLENYEANRGFSVDEPLSLMPGAKIRDYEQLIDFLENVRDGEDPYERQREEVASIAWNHRGGFCQRIADECGIDVA